MSARVSEFVCLDRDLVRRLGGRIDTMTFQRELLRASGRVVSAYDTGVTGYDPDPTAAVSRFEDPGLTAMTAPLTSARSPRAHGITPPARRGSRRSPSWP